MINLLPPLHKHKLKEEQHVRLSIILGLLLLLFFVCLSLLFLAIRIYVAGELQAQQILIGIRQQEVQEEQSPVVRIRNINQDITKLASLYGNRIVLSKTLQHIAQALPPSVHITSFQYSTAPQAGNATSALAKVSLAGFAPTTEDLLSLRTNLEQNALFQNFFFPPSNWVDSTNIDFSFTFEIQPR